MTFKKLNILLLMLAWICTCANAEKKFDESGYVNGMYIPVVNLNDGKFTHTGIIHNRLNFSYTPIKQLSFTVQMRNRLMFADYSKDSTKNYRAMTRDEGFMNLSMNVVESNYCLFNMFFDRVNVAFNAAQWSITLGRQRINWSQTLVFNPNDIFNGYSFFDYDYPERSGSDALRVCYFPTPTSAIEFAAKLNRKGKLTAAAMYRFNVKGSDIQALAGRLDDGDWFIGAGYSGEIKGVNLRAEANFFQGDKSTFVASIGADWVSNKSLFISGELLYNQQHKSSIVSLAQLYQTPMSAKHLSFSEWSVVAQVSYPFSSILSASFAAMCFIDLPMFYLSPSVDWSLRENLNLSFSTQFFIAGKRFDPSAMAMGYLRLSYNF